MTAKIILSMDGTVIKEYPLNKERMTIGRKQHNDIVIDNLAVSGEHAAVVTIMHDSFLEDLDSTNGLEVNGVPVKKHFLQSNDLIEIGKYKLKYINDQVGQASAADFEKTMILRAPPKHAEQNVGEMGEATVHATAQAGQVADAVKHAAGNTGSFEVQKAAPASPAPNASPAPVAAPEAATPAPAVQAAKPQLAAIQILTGPNAGKELDLVKNLTTLGKPGVQVAVLTRRPHGFFITHVEGASHPSVNGETLGNQPHQLSNHDLIELAGIKMEFYFKE